MTPRGDTAKRIAILSSRAPEDVRLRDALAKHLAPAEARGRLAVWHEGLLLAGAPELEVLGFELGHAAVVVALLTSDLLADTERMEIAKDLFEQGTPFVPVLGRACSVEDSLFAGLALVPRDNRTPVALWPDQGLAWNEVAAALDRVVRAPSRGELPPNNLPARRLFVGRASDLAALQSCLEQARAAGVAQPASVYGLGGVGKTSLALEYAHRHASEYPGGLFWVRAAGDPASALLAFSGELKTVAPPAVAELLRRLPDDDTRAIASGVRLALQSNPEPSLLVLDNADADWSGHLPGGAVSVLVTTHDLELALISDDRTRLRLDVLNPYDALQLAEALAGPRSDLEAEARERIVVAELEGLAVAVEMAARAVKRWTKTWVRYEAELAKQATALLGDDPRLFGEHGREHRAGTFAAIDLSIAKCPRGATKTLLESLAALAPERAPLAWVEAGAGVEADALEASVAWEALTEAGLVKVDAEAGECALHRLVHRRLRATTPQDAREARAAAMAQATLAWLSTTVDIGRIPEVETRLPHVQAVLAAIERKDEQRTWIQLADKLATHLQNCGRYTEALKLRRRALEVAEGLQPPDEQRVSVQMNNLGLVLKDMGDMRPALRLFEGALAISERLLGPEHPTVAYRLTNLARVQRHLGYPKQARRLLQRALTILDQTHSPDHPSVTTCLSVLCAVHLDLRDPAGAEPHAARTLAIKEQALGPDHPRIATSLVNLATVRHDLGDAKGAVHLLERALAIFERTLGPEHPKVAVTLEHLGVLHKELGDPERAQPLIKRALTISEKQLGPDHPQTRNSRSWLSLFPARKNP